jgi:cell wall-associated NlpC family hydrolase
MQKFFLIIITALITQFILIFTSCASFTPSKKSSNENTKISHPSDLPEFNIDIEEEDIPNVPNDNLEVNQRTVVDKIYSDVKSSYKKEKFMQQIISYLNTPYLYGGETKDGIDCSAFTQQIYFKSFDILLPRTARDQYGIDDVFNDRDLLKFGDLVYFNTSDIYFPGHVGIYLEDDLFVHSSSSNGVIISSLNNSYYSSKFIGANRVKTKK